MRLLQLLRFDLGSLGFQWGDAIGHGGARLLCQFSGSGQSDVRVGTDGVAVLLAMQPVLQPPQLRTGPAVLARCADLQIKPWHRTVSVPARLAQGSDFGIAQRFHVGASCSAFR
ncbi:hypothetical protein D3C85_1213740 [compost metagenome]